MGKIILNNSFTLSMTPFKFIYNVCDIFRGPDLFPKSIKWGKTESYIIKVKKLLSN